MGKRKENRPPPTLERELLRFNTYLDTAVFRLIRGELNTEVIHLKEELHGIGALAERKRRLKALLLKLIVRGVDLAAVYECLVEAYVEALKDASYVRIARTMREAAQPMHEVLDPVRQRLHALHRERGPEQRRGERAIRTLSYLLAEERFPKAPAHRPARLWLQEVRRTLKALRVPRSAAEEFLKLGGFIR